jgi:signal transduction histidine kinase
MKQGRDPEDAGSPRYDARVVTSTASSRTGLTIRAALFLGFGVTLGLWLWAGYRLTQRFSDAESASAQVNERYLKAQESLRDVDGQVRLGSVLLRDVLFAADDSGLDVNRTQLEGTYAAAEQAVRRYVPVTTSADELDAVRRLRTEIESYRLAGLAVLRSNKPGGTSALLQQRVVPQRETVLRLSSRVQALNREAFVAHTLATAQVYRAAQRDGWRQLGLALAANLAIGIWAGLYAGRLESRLRDQRARDLQLTSDLHRLSAKVVSVQEEERRMIARELHDEVGQALAAIRVELAFAQRPQADAAAVGARLDDVRKITEGAVNTIRDLSHLLHPSILDDLGLVAALESLVRNFGTRHGVKMVMRHEGMSARLAPDLETAIYRIVQEALNNVAKHARARACTVSVVREGRIVRVTIADDGGGFAAEPGADATGHGLGLIGMRERAVLLGGTLSVATEPGEGTRLVVEFPGTNT